MHLVHHGRRGHRAERVEDRLRPGLHLLALAARQVAELLAADGVQRPEHHDLAVRAPLHHQLQAGAQRQRRLAGAGPAAQRDDADLVVEQQVQRDPLLGRPAAQPERLPLAADQPDLLAGGHPAQRRAGRGQQLQPGVARQARGRRRGRPPPCEQRVDRLGRPTSSSAIPVQPDGDRLWPGTRRPRSPTAAAFTRSGMSLVDQDDSPAPRRFPAARLSAQARIRESLLSLRNPAGSTPGRRG